MTIKRFLEQNFKWIEVKTYYGKVSYYACYTDNDNNFKHIKIDGNEIHKVLQNKIHNGEFNIIEPKGKTRVARLIFND